MDLVSISNCTGCGICSYKCKRNAIVRRVDEFGFSLFSVDKENCIECGLCLKSCPSYSKLMSNETNHCYLSWSNNDTTHFESASGGLSTEIGKFYIEQGGYVCGCVWDENFDAVLTVVDTLDDLKRTQGSKYVHSIIPETVFEELEVRDKKGQKGVIIALPCQIAAVRKLNLKNLLTIDLLCHGGCSPTAFRTHLSHLKSKYKISNITDVKFRGGKYDCNLTLWDRNKIVYRGFQYVDEYFYTFMKHSLFRTSCYNCKYARNERVSDITLADFWGINPEFIKGKHILNGTNLLLVNTERGCAIISALGNRIRIYKRDFKEAVAGNDTLKKPTSMPKDRDLDIHNYKKYGFEDMVHRDLKWRLNYCRHQIAKYKKKLWHLNTDCLVSFFTSLNKASNKSLRNG